MKTLTYLIQSQHLSSDQVIYRNKMKHDLQLFKRVLI